MKYKATVMNSDDMNKALKRLSHEIIEDGAENACIIGIRTRGVPLAKRIAVNLMSIEGIALPKGILDITLNRDDLLMMDHVPEVKNTEVDFDVTGMKVILCDDVLYTGRTIRAAIDAIMELGRPKCIRLLTLIDRGHRELPIRADFVGKNLPTSKNEKVIVNLIETDGKDSVEIFSKE